MHWSECLKHLEFPSRSGGNVSLSCMVHTRVHGRDYYFFFQFWEPNTFDVSIHCQGDFFSALVKHHKLKQKLCAFAISISIALMTIKVLVCLTSRKCMGLERWMTITFTQAVQLKGGQPWNSDNFSGDIDLRARCRNPIQKGRLSTEETYGA